MTITLEILVAEAAITRVLRRYCRAMDQMDRPMGYSVWHEDGLAAYDIIFSGTGRGFVDWACDYHATLQSQSHQISNILIDVRGDKAVSEAYVTAGLLTRPDQAGKQRLTTARGRYLDEWSCRNGIWAIDKRRFVHDLVVAQDAEALPGLPLMIRGLDDPSYALLGAIGRA